MKDPAYMLQYPYIKQSEYEERKPSTLSTNNTNGSALLTTETINMINLPITHTSNPDVDSMMQIHRRKMLRRAANRKSGKPSAILLTSLRCHSFPDPSACLLPTAQLSRARKKAHMEELKLENARLQKVVDILESQPELLFCVTIDGKITYIAERTLNFVKSALPNKFSEKDPIHINQILSDESVNIVLRTVAQLEAETEHESMSSVKVIALRYYYR
jgi:hypothetical protein